MDTDIQIPAALQRLLGELEAPSPSIQELEVQLGSNEYGGFFKSKTSRGESEDGGRARVRLRALSAIGNCTSLRVVDLNPSGKRGVYSVTEAEARALLEALQQSNRVLTWLNVYGWNGFGSAAACVALAGLVRSTPTLTRLYLQYVELTSEGLGHIAAALRGTNHCSLRGLGVSGNRLIGGGGDDGGAQYLADIISHTPTLRTLDMDDIGMDVAGGEIIAKALPNNQSLVELTVGWRTRDGLSNNDESAPVSRILRVLTPPVTQAGGSKEQSSIQTPCHTPSIIYLWLLVHGSTGLIESELREGLADMLRSSTFLHTLVISTVFLGHGLEALTSSTSMTSLYLHHDSANNKHVDFTMLTSIVYGCKQLKFLKLWGNYPAEVKRQIFQDLNKNPSIKHLIIDKWDGLEDDMFKVLMTSLQVNTILETISMKGTTWDNEGKSAIVDELLKQKYIMRLVTESEECYLDTNVKCGKKRGAAVIISMEAFTNGSRRRGAEVDRGRLESLANSLKLDYDGRVFLNSSAAFVRKELPDLAQTGILTDDECFVCFVNAHGGTGKDGAFFFTDCDGSRIWLLKDVVEPFRKCKNLVGKPKIFFVNACRGGLKLQSIEDTVDGLEAIEEQPIPSSWSEGAEARYVEQEADCLIVFSTSQHAASPRDVEYGTNFVYALMRAVNKYRGSKDLVTILTHMNNNLVYMDHEETDAASGKVRKLKQCLVFTSSLRKPVYWRDV